MKKKEEINLYRVLIFSVCLMLFLTALITKEFILTSFGLVLLIGANLIIYFSQESKTKEVKKKKKESDIKLTGIWDKFISWLNK